ncbi:MAG: arsenite methyltransferase [Bacteroidales bacterium]
MQNSEALKEIVKQKYSEIAAQQNNDGNTCCGSSCCSDEIFNMMTEEYKDLDGYCAEADMGLGCGLPTEFAAISEGDVVVDLGSGAGNDCFVARNMAGERGRVIGVDFTPAMIEKARENALKSGYTNVEFIQGDIENMPLGKNIADIVISNCVLNLVPDKKKAFSEVYRIMKPGGQFCVSDIVLIGELPDKIRAAAAMYAGCISGALQKMEYLGIVESGGFTNLRLRKEVEISLPDKVLKPYLSDEEINDFRVSGTGIFSITITGMKPDSIGCGCSCGH